LDEGGDVAEALNPERETQVNATVHAEPLRRRGFGGHLQLRNLRPTRGWKLTRVGVAYLVLAAAVGGAAAGIALALTGSDGSKPAAVPASERWSAWAPTGIGSTAARQIARHVSSQYRLPGGKQLVNVIAHSPALASGLQVFAIGAVEITPDKRAVRLNSDQARSDAQHGLDGARIFPVGEGVMYILCGSADDCSIGDGKPSAARGALVRREALELALYTFKYVQGAESVLAFVPPAPGSQAKHFIFLQRSDVASYLDRPLASTIGPTRTLRPNDLSEKERGFVDAVAVPNLFVLNQTQQLPDGTLALVLAPETLPPL
jgi:hypothetical protein